MTRAHRTRRSGIRVLVAATLAVLGLLPAAAGDSPWEYDEEGLKFESGEDGFLLRVRNRAQVRFTLESLDDGGDSKGSFDIARYKLTLSGRAFGAWEYRLQGDLAGGSESSGRLLEDAFVVYARNPRARLWVGQGKAFFGRQQLTSSADLQFVDRSIASERFAHGRDVGIGLFGANRNGTYEYNLGLYNGNGINKDEGDNVDYMGVLRLVFTPYGPFAPAENDLDRPETSRLAIGVSLFTNTTGTEGFEEERVSRGGLELAYKKRGFQAVAEFFTESADIRLGDPQEEEDTDGWYLQAGFLFPGGFEIAGRYSEILFDVAHRDETETGLVFGYHFEPRHGATNKGPRILRGNKVQLDYRRLEFEFDPDALVPRPEERIDRDELRLQLQIVF